MKRKRNSKGTPALPFAPLCEAAKGIRHVNSTRGDAECQWGIEWQWQVLVDLETGAAFTVALPGWTAWDSDLLEMREAWEATP